MFAKQKKYGIFLWTTAVSKEDIFFPLSLHFFQIFELSSVDTLIYTIEREQLRNFRVSFKEILNLRVGFSTHLGKIS